MTLHHTKHHATYITNLNATLTALTTSLSTADLPTNLHLQAALTFHAGGHINHTLFWENLSPPASPAADPSTAPSVIGAVTKRYGSLAQFQAAFNAVLLGIKGSGWGWLVQDGTSGELDIVTSKDQDIVPAGKKPLLGVDMWEHAYYLQYLNDKKSYVEGIWKIVNWDVVEKRFKGGNEAVWGELKGLKAGL